MVVVAKSSQEGAGLILKPGADCWDGRKCLKTRRKFPVDGETARNYNNGSVIQLDDATMRAQALSG